MYLLLFFFPQAQRIFDFGRGFTFMDKELRVIFPELEKKGGTREADMLVKVFLLDGTEKWVLVHIEIQEQYADNFPKRMFQYFYRIYDRFNVGVTAIAVFTGKAKPLKNEFSESLLGTETIYRYNSYHVHNHTEAELFAMNNPFALVVIAAQKALLADKIPQQELGDARLNIAKTLIDSGKFDHQQIAAFLYFLKNFLHIENSDINATFDRQTDSLTGKTSAMGIIETIKMLEREQGREEGQEMKNYEFVKNLLQQTDFNISKIASLASVSEAFVLKIKHQHVEGNM